MMTSLLVLAAMGCSQHSNSAINVRIEKTSRGFALTRAGKPFVIKGAGGNGSLQLLRECGGNAVRTWGADDLAARLDNAQKHGLVVVAGIWLLHGDGMDYGDSAKVAAQKAQCKAIIEKFKDHPALLMWSFGNETEGFGGETDPKIWQAIEDIAKMSKAIDPNHPSMTVIAEAGGDRVPSIQKYCPSLDAVGINSYGGGSTVVKRFKEAGGKKPVILTEFGPPGSWETGKTEWGAPFEMTSTEKAAFYRSTYTKSVVDQAGSCLGSFAFLWSSKVEATPTWFGMFLADGSRLGAVDEMTQLWSGKPSPNLCPRIEPIQSMNGLKFNVGSTQNFHCTAKDPEGKPLTANWSLAEEVKPHPPGVDAPMPKNVTGAILSSGVTAAEVRMPSEPGAYRLYVVVRDDKGAAATANLPILVEKKP